jgi:hypothetical protein
MPFMIKISNFFLSLIGLQVALAKFIAKLSRDRARSRLLA